MPHKPSEPLSEPVPLLVYFNGEAVAVAYRSDGDEYGGNYASSGVFYLPVGYSPIGKTVRNLIDAEQEAPNERTE